MSRHPKCNTHPVSAFRTLFSAGVSRVRECGVKLLAKMVVVVAVVVNRYALFHSDHLQVRFGAIFFIA